MVPRRETGFPRSRLAASFRVQAGLLYAYSAAQPRINNLYSESGLIIMKNADSIPSSKSKMGKYKHWVTGWLFVLPCAAVLLLMALYPLIQVLQFSFSDVKVIGFQTEFVGTRNFEQIFSSPDLGVILRQTILWTVISLSLRIMIGFSAALMMETGMKGKTFFRVATLIPWVVPSIVAANTWRWVYNPDVGLINMFMRRLIPDFSVVWIRDYALGSVIASYVWTGFPFIMLMVMAGLQGIPSDYKEAAQIDGANAIQVFWHVTLPNLKNILMIIIVLELITGFNAFDLIFTMTGGGPGIQSTILGIMIYNLAFVSRNFGLASAASVILLGIILVFFLTYVPIAAVGGRKKGQKGAL